MLYYHLHKVADSLHPHPRVIATECDVGKYQVIEVLSSVETDTWMNAHDILTQGYECPCQNWR